MLDKEFIDQCKKELELVGFRYSDEEAERLIDCAEDLVNTIYAEGDETDGAE